MKRSNFLKKQLFSKDRSIHPLIRIFCEGKTEKEYFELLRIKYRLNIEITPKDEKQDKLIDFVEKDIKDMSLDSKDSVWCLIDVENNKEYWVNSRVSSKIKNFSNNKNKFVIISNPCFEIWLLSYFLYSTKKTSLEELEKSLSKLLDEKYKKIPSITKNSSLFMDFNKISLAIVNSKKLIKYHKQENRDIYNFESNPSTNMHELIDFLLLKKSGKNI
jgi:hypothetical protein